MLAWRWSGSLPRVYTQYRRCLSQSSHQKAISGNPGKGPSEHYEALVRQGTLRADDYQRTVVAKLQTLHDELKTFKPEPIPEPLSHTGNIFSRLIGRGQAPEVPSIPENVPKGMYLYGDVGCGKTMLMNIFYDTIPESLAHSKRRVHFHAFMDDVHHRSHELGVKHLRGKDSIVPIARALARESRVLCFDEFQVLDIVDAMILKRLMESLIAYGTICILTSNRAPDDLYKNGIQRVSFLPCIDLIKSRFNVEDLDSGTDYRKLPQALSKVYYHPITPEHRLEIEKLYSSLAGRDVQTNRKLKVWGRPVNIPSSSKNVARFTFKELCGTPMSAADYMEITKTFPTIFITDMPQLTLNQKDQARRFILFIDSCYENQTKLFCLSDPPIEQIFSDRETQSIEISDQMRSTIDDLGMSADQIGASSIFSGDEEVFAFARAVSRLHQMGTKAWANATAK